MSLPSSEPLPTNINELPPARQRHIRRQPRAASPAERGILLDSLLEMTGPSLNYFLLSILGSILFGLSLFFNEPIGVILGLVTAPFLIPVFALAIFPQSHKVSHWLKSLISLIITIILFFTSGVIAGYLQKTGQIDRLDSFWLRTPFWLDLAAVILSSFFCILILLRQGDLPRKVGIILTYEILFPIGISGFGFPLGKSSLWPNFLVIGMGHLLLAISVAILSLLILSFGPKHVKGWILSLVASFLTVILILGGLGLNPDNLYWLKSSQTGPTRTMEATSTEIPSPTISPTKQPTSTPTKNTQTFTKTSTTVPSPTITPAPSLTPSPQPTTFIIVIDSLNGLVIREAADFEAPVVGYANDGESYEVLNQSVTENGSLWYQVEINTGETGWLLSSLVNTQTPTANESN